MPDLTIPLIAATVFTAGGYGILNSKRHAERIEEFLVMTFVMCTLLAMIGMAMIVAVRLTPRPMPSQTARAPTLPADRPATSSRPIVYAGD